MAWQKYLDGDFFVFVELMSPKVNCPIASFGNLSLQNVVTLNHLQPEWSRPISHLLIRALLYFEEHLRRIMASNCLKLAKILFGGTLTIESIRCSLHVST